MSRVTHPPTVFYSSERGVEIQEAATIALNEERFNFSVAVRRFIDLLPTADEGEEAAAAIINGGYCDEHADDVFYLLLNLFNEDMLPFEAEQMFLAALEAGQKNPFEDAINRLPDDLQQDRNWQALLYIMTTPRFRGLIDHYIDFEKGEVDIRLFDEREIGVLSSGEQFLAQLALHLFNDSNPLPNDGLTGLRLLDAIYFQRAVTAIRIAHQTGSESLVISHSSFASDK